MATRDELGWYTSDVCKPYNTVANSPRPEFDTVGVPSCLELQSTIVLTSSSSYNTTYLQHGPDFFLPRTVY